MVLSVVIGLVGGVISLISGLIPKHTKHPKFCRPKIGMWGVYPEAMVCNVDGLYSDFNRGEQFLR